MHINYSFTCDNKELGINKMSRSRGVVENLWQIINCIIH